jgi:hypothetical protein
MPPPISSQLDRSLGDASNKRGNHTNGAETTRPSDKVTDSASFEHDTSTASASVFSTKVLMPFLRKELRVLQDDLPNLYHLVPAKTPIIGDRYRMQPNLRIAPGVTYMNVRRLTPLML